MSRPTCSQCAQPQVRCICPWVQPVKNRVPVLILQHPKEAGSAKNTARLLHLSLSNSALHVDETFCAPRLMELLGDGKTNVDRKSTRLNSSHVAISYAVFCLKKKKMKKKERTSTLVTILELQDTSTMIDRSMQA